MSKKDIIKLIVIAAVLVLCVLLADGIGKSHDNEETDIVKNAVKNAAITCYAVEGAYPDDVQYLRDNYQLAYDEERYFVTFESFAPNIIPSIYITERGAGLD